jgi:hypothetical protein
MTKPCPICQQDAQTTIWPYLKGGTGANGERIDWMRCSGCHALFSDLTMSGDRRSYPVRATDVQHEDRVDDRPRGKASAR